MGIPGWPLSRKLRSRSQGHSSGLRQVLQQVSGSPQSPHPLTVHAIREACDISPLVTERPSRAESPRSPVAQKNKGEGMAADSPLCPAGAKSDLTGQQGLHGAMDVTGESSIFLQGQREAWVTVLASQLLGTGPQGECKHPMTLYNFPWLCTERVPC